MFTAPVLLSVSGSAGMLLLGTDTEAASSVVVASDPVQTFAFILAALTALAGLIGLCRALCTFLSARPVVVTERRLCEVCNDSAQRAAHTSAESICALCGSGRSGTA